MQQLEYLGLPLHPQPRVNSRKPYREGNRKHAGNTENTETDYNKRLLSAGGEQGPHCREARQSNLKATGHISHIDHIVSPEAESIPSIGARFIGLVISVSVLWRCATRNKGAAEVARLPGGRRT
jgi:hypothetical protein